MMVATQTALRAVRPATAMTRTPSFLFPISACPVLAPQSAELKAKFGFGSGSKVTYRADRPAGGYADIAQYLGYVLKSGTVTGVAVGESSIPTTH